jgi:hypothetical protein
MFKVIWCDETSGALVTLLSAHTNYYCSEALNISLIRSHELRKLWNRKEIFKSTNFSLLNSNFRRVLNVVCFLLGCSTLRGTTQKKTYGIQFINYQF